MRTPFAFSMIAIFLVVAAVLGGCTLVEPKATPVPTPNIPRVRFLFPENNARIAQDSEITVDILAEDETSGIARVEFLVDNIKINEGQPDGFAVPAFRAAMNWIAGTPGGHTLHAIAYRADGTRSDEAIILVDVVAR